jgi:hypothetical protein
VLLGCCTQCSVELAVLAVREKRFCVAKGVDRNMDPGWSSYWLLKPGILQGMHGAWIVTATATADRASASEMILIHDTE